MRTACNQSSSRDPAVDYDDRTVLDGIARLKERGLLRTVWSGAGSRVLEYPDGAAHGGWEWKLCSASTAPTSRITAGPIGEEPTTSVRRRISLFSRSRGLFDQGRI